MKLDFTIQPEDEPGLTYKKFVRLVHKQVTSCNPGYPNSKINAVIGAAWKDLKAELQERNCKNKELTRVDPPKTLPKGKANIATKSSLEMHEQSPDTSSLEAEAEVINEAEDEKGEEEMKSSGTKKEAAGCKKKRVLGPIRIKLSKAVISQKSVVKVFLFLLLNQVLFAMPLNGLI